MTEWLSLAEIKAYTKITDTSQDADIQFQLDNFRGQTRVVRYINRGLDYVLPVDFEQAFAKYILYLVKEMQPTTASNRVVKSWSFDGESQTFEDSGGSSSTTGALSMFKPLRKFWA